MQPYAYAGNDPVNMVDPLGLAPWDVVDDAWDATGGKVVSAVSSVGKQDVANLAGGVLNTITFGNEQRLNRALGQDGNVRRDSGFYTAGEVAGIAAPAGALKVAGLSVKTWHYANAGGRGYALLLRGSQLVLVRADCHLLKVKQSFRFLPKSWVGQQKMLPHLHFMGSNRHWPYQTLKPR